MRLNRVQGAVDADPQARTTTKMTHPMKILIVDGDGAHNAKLLGEVTPAVQLVAAQADQVAEVLARSPVDGVALDLDLDDDTLAGVVGEVERRYAGVPLVALVSRVDDAKIESACHLGAVAVMAKPFGLSALVHAMSTPNQDAGFIGSCGGIPTAQLLSLHRAAGNDGVLHLTCPATSTRPEKRGSIFLEGGQPVHATAGDLVGAEAVHAMLSWCDAEASWLGGVTRCARTIVGRWEGLLAASSNTKSEPQDLDRMIAVAYPDVVEKLVRLAQTPDVLGAFLLRNAEVLAGRCVPTLDESLAGRALCRLAHVYFDVEAQPQSGTTGEIQAVIGDLRLVLDRIGPPGAGFQVGVVVRQAAPVCKSLRRLLRQIDAAFARAMPQPRRDRGEGRERMSAVA